MGLLIFPFFFEGGQSFPSSAIWKSWSYYSRELERRQACDVWLKNFLSCYSFLIVNCAIMIINNQVTDWWIFCSVQEPYLLILGNLQSNKRHKKETLRFFAYMHLSKREIFYSYEISRKFFTFFLAFLINHLV